MLSRLCIAGSVAIILAACENPAAPSSEWTCTVTLEAEDFTRTITGSATATGGSREDAERAARASLCRDDRLGLSAGDQSRCEQFGAAPSGFTSWRLDSSCTTD